MGGSFQKGITTPLGFRAAGQACGIKPSGKPDLAIITADEPCSAAGVFTKNRMVSPSVVVAKRHARSGIAQAIVCNSGISNAATGMPGQQDAESMCRHVADHVEALGRRYRHVLPCSTGVIGPSLPMDKITTGIESLSNQLSRGRDANEDVAWAIMTTDLVPKHAYQSLQLKPARSGGKANSKKGQGLVHLAGVAKGSGMIAPNMATMLVFITTDVAITPPQLKRALRQATSESFNRISVDSHTSPSDSVLILASGRAGNVSIRSTGPALDRFTTALTLLCRDLAYQVVQDGEGATRIYGVTVTGAKSTAEADRVGRAVVDSPLVKTAVHGADPNWGRIVTAAGYSGARLDPDGVSLSITAAKLGQWPGDVSTSKTPGRAASKADPSSIAVFKKGQPCQLDRATTRRLTKIMRGKAMTFTIDLNQGKASAHWLGCDLSQQYVTINADYTT